jgi:hypothetical protein
VGVSTSVTRGLTLRRAACVTALTAAALLVAARVLVADRQYARIIVAALVGVYFVAYAFWVIVAPRGVPREDE